MATRARHKIGGRPRPAVHLLIIIASQDQKRSVETLAPQAYCSAITQICALPKPNAATDKSNHHLLINPLHLHPRQPTFPAAHAKARFPAAFDTADAIGDVPPATPPRQDRGTCGSRGPTRHAATQAGMCAGSSQPRRASEDSSPRSGLLASSHYPNYIFGCPDHHSHARPEYRTDIRRADRSHSVILKTSRQ